MRKLSNLFLTFFCVSIWGLHICEAQNGNYKAIYAQEAPTIDGDTSDIVWDNIKTWYTFHQVWLNNVGTTPSAADFSWKYKLAWREDRFYILAVITDDVISDRYSNPLDRYYEDDCFEVFFDEDNSGGPHQNSFQAFAYHVSLKYDIVDSDQNGTPRLLNDHATVRMDTVDGKYVWEAAFKIYDNTFTISNPGQPVTLFAGKTMGWGLAYCDNDGRASRDHFFGSENVEGTNKNVAYINADVFGEVELINTLTPPAPTFNHLVVDNGLTKPTAMQIAPNGDIYVCEQAGNLKVLKNGELQSSSLVRVTANTEGDSFTERGLLGLVLDPHFEHNNHIYLYYTTSAEGYAHNRVSRFTLNGTSNVSATEVIITELDSLSTAQNHNGGAMHFGTDGKLYIVTGENATPSHSQNLGNTHGKLLRINKDGTVPSDNPFYATEGADPRIWSYGLRNPFTFDISSSGKVLLNDVGFESWEEINDATQAGKNFGWPLEEGPLTDASFDKPLYAYHHRVTSGTSDSTGCAITGGTFFEPLTTNYPQEYIGKYFFMDYCGNWINVMDPSNGSGRKTFAINVARSPIAIDYHPDGNLYYLTRQNGTIYKIVYTGEPVPVITRQPEVINVTVGNTLSIPITVSGEETLVYTWKKNGTLLTGYTTATLEIANVQYSDSGNYVLTVTNALGTAISKTILVRVLEYNTAPIVVIEPVSDTTFQGGQVYKIIGSATDEEDGVLSSASFTWSVDLHHGSHVHDGVPISGSDTLVFTVPVAGGHSETNIFYRITLIVLDSKGVADTAYVDLHPELVDLTIKSIPSGLKFTLDGSPYTTPYTVQTIKGFRRTLGAYAPQEVQGVTFLYNTWDHSTDSVNFVVPISNSTYTVQYKNLVLADTDVLQNRKWEVYPNPFTNDGLYMHSKSPYKYHIHDLPGNLLEDGTILGEIYIGKNLAKGVYILGIEVNSEIKSFKIVKE